MTGITFITLGSHDFEKEIAFCKDGLGFGEPVRHASGNLAYWQQGGLHLAIHPAAMLCEDAGVSLPNLKSPHEFGGTTVSINVGSELEVDTAMAMALRHGGSAQKPAERAHWGGYRGYVTSPSQHFWEICYNPFLNKM